MNEMSTCMDTGMYKYAFYCYGFGIRIRIKTCKFVITIMSNQVYEIKINYSRNDAVRHRLPACCQPDNPD